MSYDFRYFTQVWEDEWEWGDQLWEWLGLWIASKKAHLPGAHLTKHYADDNYRWWCAQNISNTTPSMLVSDYKDALSHFITITCVRTLSRFGVRSLYYKSVSTCVILVTVWIGLAKNTDASVTMNVLVSSNFNTSSNFNHHLLILTKSVREHFLLKLEDGGGQTLANTSKQK